MSFSPDGPIVLKILDLDCEIRALLKKTKSIQAHSIFWQNEDCKRKHL